MKNYQENTDSPLRYNLSAKDAVVAPRASPGPRKTHRDVAALRRGGILLDR
ncbi:hypothetical protein Y032_0323g2467, partial [Ancylostoma ceylanicum]